ncbi:protein kinase domain-containing protein [Sorangium sp. So ce385]|uniref:serine/threonine-protein kinase n=1 Tax=Sorangium sp. So ce385 TaxID=3133308 RepID=UPI003F5BC97F
MTAPIDEGMTGDASAVDSSPREVPRVDDAPLPCAAADQAGPFRLGARIGEGGMGVVYAAHDPGRGSKVAVKILPAALGRDPARVRRFEAEAEVLAALDHPAIVRYLAHGTTPAGEPFLAMEWLDGEDLAQRLRRGRLSAAESVALARRVAEALAEAHARGVVHRDIKPSNIFLVGGEVEKSKVIDFGVARVAHGARPRTASGLVIGTPGYMAPEQARGAPNVDARADVFALGAVLFECLTGAPAFHGENLMAILTKILFAEVPRVTELRPHLSRELAELTARMLAKAPEERPRDGAAVAAALDALAALEATVVTLQAPVALETVGSIPALPPSGASPAALTGGERRLLSVILIGEERADPAARTVARTEAEDGLAVLRSAAAANGGRAERLVDGSIVVSIEGAGSATDRAALAARCALSLRPLAGRRPMALALGRAERTGRLGMGDAIDTAARLIVSSGAPPSRPEGDEEAQAVAIDEVTARLLDARFVVKESAPGLALLGERALAGEARTLLGRATPCVGRDRELAALEGLFRACVEERTAQAAIVLAPPGIGKSRVAHELLRALRGGAEPPSIWIGHGDPLRAGSAYGLLGQALRGALDLHEGEPLDARRQKLRAAAATRASLDAAAATCASLDAAARMAAFLGELVGTPFPDDESAPLRAARQDPRLMSEHVQRAWVDFLRAEARARPVLLVLEDLHWGDLPTVRAVDRALRDVKEEPWMVLALARPEVRDVFPRLWQERAVQEIRLRELSKKASERLARLSLGDEVDSATVDRLVSQADGNAFYLEELIRAVAEGKGAALPETVLAMVQSRLEGLGAGERRVLRAASVFGEVCWEGGVAALSGDATQAAEVRERLAALVEREILVRRQESRLPGEPELAFRHALLRDGAYAMLTDADRTLGHRLAGEWLERHGEGDALVLAEHFERGGERPRAALHYRAAARQAQLGSDLRAAIAHAERGLSCDVTGEHRLAFLEIFVYLRWLTGDMASAETCAEELLLRAPKSSPAFSSALLIMAVMTLQRGQIDALLRIVEMLTDVPPSADNANQLLTAYYIALLFFMVAGLPDLWRSHIDRVEVIAQAASPHDLQAQGAIASIRGHTALYLQGELQHSAELQSRASACFEATDNADWTTMAHATAAMIYEVLGAYHQAEEEARRALSSTNAGVFCRSVARITLAWTLANRGELDDATAESELALREGVSHGDRAIEGWARATYALVLRLRGDLDAAAREAEASLALPAFLPLQRAETLASFAAVRLAQGRAAEALDHARDAMDLLRSSPTRPPREPFIRFIHIETLIAAGEHDAAREALAVARERLLATAAKVSDPELRRSFLEDVAYNARTLALACP